MHKQIRFLSGLHAGAQLLCEDGAQYSIGADRSCSIVLCDVDVAERHCLLSVDSFGVTCRALEAPFTLDGKVVAAGQVATLEDFQVVQCGPVQLSVGPAEGHWPEAEEMRSLRTATTLNVVHSLRRVNPYVLFATVLFGLTCVLGLAYATLSDAETEVSRSGVEAARSWLSSISPRGSELEIGAEGTSGSRLLLSGYVADAEQLAQLDGAVRKSGLDLRVQVYAVDEMLASMTRLAALARIPCAAEYQRGGRVVCTNVVDSEALATKLQMIARDVPGLRALEVAVFPPQPKSEPPPVPRQISEKFAVLMFRGERYLVGRHGKRYVEGDEFDGFRIERIELDQVLFEREGRSYEFRVAALRAAP